MTTENLPAVLSDSAKAYLQAVDEGVLGGSGYENTSPYEQLKISQENGTTNEGIEIPFGHFYIPGLAGVSSKSIVIRPLGMWYKVVRTAGEEENWKPLGETIYFNDFGTEHPDTFGTVDCGRIFGKLAKQFNDEQRKAQQAKGKVSADLFAYVEFPDAKDSKLIKWRASASKMGRITQAFNKKVSGVDRPQFRKFKVTTYLPKDDPLLSPAEKLSARNTYVNVVVEPLMDKIYKVDELAEDGGKLLEYVREYNNTIMEKHYEAVSNREIGNTIDTFIDGDYEVVNDAGEFNSNIKPL